MMKMLCKALLMQAPFPWVIILPAVAAPWQGLQAA